MTVEESDVLVVGAGPVGLWLSCELARAGVRVRLVDRRIAGHRTRVRSRCTPGRSRTSRCGIERRWLDEGRPVPTGHYATLPSRLDLTRLDSDFNFAFAIPPLQTELFLVDLAAALGVQVETGCEFVSLTQRADEGSAVLRDRDGGHEIVARFMVGYDGRRSAVHAAAGNKLHRHRGRAVLHDRRRSLPTRLPRFDDAP